MCFPVSPVHLASDASLEVWKISVASRSPAAIQALSVCRCLCRCERLIHRCKLRDSQLAFSGSAASR
jgi:hypothetical protein